MSSSAFPRPGSTATQSTQFWNVRPQSMSTRGQPHHLTQSASWAEIKDRRTTFFARDGLKQVTIQTPVH